MTTNSQLSTTKPKNKNKNELSKQLEQDEETEFKKVREAQEPLGQL